MTRKIGTVDNPVEKVDNSPNERNSSRALVVFCKAPVPGQVKTRLCPPLSAEQAAELYRVALDETVQRFSGQGFDLLIYYTGDEDFFIQNYSGSLRQPQCGVDLGSRMEQALQTLLCRGYVQVVLIGSDSPDLPLSLVEQAFSALHKSDVVIAPAADGGYVLIGEKVHYPDLFHAMPWSQANLMTETINWLTRQQISWRQLPDWEDLDDICSLKRLLQRSPHSRTATYSKKTLAALVDLH